MKKRLGNAALLGFLTSQSFAASLYNLSIDTSKLPASGGPYQLYISLIDGSGTGDANNSISLSNFVCTGSSINGCPSNVQSLTDQRFLQTSTFSFTAGGVLFFSLTATGNLDADGVPDAFQLSILDANGNPIPTSDPSGADAVLFIQCDRQNPKLQSYGSPSGTGATLDAPGLTASSVTLTDSSSPSVFGQAVTLTATVSPSTATGRVTFYDGAIVLGTQALANGQAALTTSVLAFGAHSLTAYYSGDGSDAASTSTASAQMVNALQGNGLSAAVSYGAGVNPYSVAAGDFNGDGKTDLVVANYSSNNVSVLLGNGDGTFQSAVSYATGVGSYSVAVGDFNGDGKADLAVANYGSDNVSVLLGNGDGTFQSAVNYATGNGSYSVAVADLNGDGNADLVVVNENSNNVSVLLGNGDGTFQTAVNYPAGSGPVSVVVGDFNGDGKVDLAVANYGSNNISVLLGNGDGTFQTAVNYSAGINPSSIAVGDFNGDGKADLAVANYGSNNISVLLGNGDGTFQTAVNYSAGINPSSIAVGDFNGDGKADLAVANYGSNNVSLLLGNGDGSFQGAVNYATGNGPISVAVGEFNGDGRPDLAVAAYNSNTVNMWLGNATTLMETTTTLASSNHISTYGQSVTLTATVSPSTATGRVTFYDGAIVLGTQALANGQAALTTSVLAFGAHSLTAYYSGDGSDAASTSTASAQMVNALQGNGLSAAVSYGAGVNPYSVAAGDFNGDGKTDLVVANYSSNNVSVLLGNGDGTFQSAVSYATGVGSYSVAVGDFNGDGKADLAVANYGSDNVSVLLGNGDGTFQSAVNYATGNGSYSVAVADLNGDGNADLVVVNENSNNVSVLLGNGDGTFQTAVNYPAGSGPVSVVVGDFNGDGKVDLAVANYGSNNISVLLGNGDGTFQTAVNYSAGINPSSIAVGDFNGDGKADLAVANYGSNNISVLLGNGDGTFQTAVNYSAGINPSSIAVGDFNGDGKADLAVANYGSNNVSLLLGNGDGSFQGAVNYATGNGPISVAVGEFNGDGRPDLAVAAYNSNTVNMWLGNATTLMETTTTLASSNHISTYGQSVTLTATVSPSTATGRVTFYDGAIVLGTQALANGQAALTTSVLAFGAHSLTAYYSGDGSDAASTSTASAQMVNALQGNGLSAAVSYGAGVNPYSVAAGDFNGDGKTDLVVANYSSNNVSVLLGNGDGTFQSAVSYATGVGSYSVAVGDFNGDGKADLAVANYGSDNVSVLLGNGDGTFQSAVNYATGNGSYSVAVADLNGDGNADLVVVNENSNNVSVLLGNGDGTFQTAVNYPAGSGPVSVVVGDFNGDGKVDLAVANYGSNNISVLLGNGDGTFQTAVNYSAGINPSSIAVGDFNGDGKADLAVANYGSNNISVLLGNGDGTFQTAVNYSAGINPSSIAVGDFNGDGKADLAVANYGSNNVSLLLGNGDGSFQGAVNYATGNGPISVAVGEFNGDGRPDLAVAAYNSNTVNMWLGKLLTTQVQLSASSLALRTTLLGSTSGIQPVTLTNVGSTSLTINGISLAGANPSDFGQTNTCGGSVAGGASCSVSVTFIPSAAGTRTASVSIGDSDSASPQSITLTGTGTQVKLSPAGLTFPSTNVSSTSAAQTATLTNLGSTPLTIGGISVSTGNPSDFSQTNTCGTSVAAGANCIISVAFTPTAAGTRIASVSVSDSGGASPQAISLSGSATQVQLSTSSLTFPSTTLGSGSAAQTVTLTNVGSTTLIINGISLMGANPADYAQSNTCGSSVAAGTTCSMSLTFSPTATGTRSGVLTVADSGGSSPQSVMLTGMGTVPIVSMSRTSLTFGTQSDGIASTAQAVTLKNVGTAALSIASIAARGDYVQTNTCGSSVAAGGNCSISVTFSPTATGARNGAVTITDNATGSPQSIALTGTGTQVKLSVSSLAFPTTRLSTPTGPQPVTLTNVGSTSLTINGISLAGANPSDFSQTSTCGSSVAAGGSCTISVTFTPTAVGTRTSSVSINDSDAASPQSILLSGTGTQVKLSASILVFPSTTVGTSSAAQTVTLTNLGSTGLVISSISLAGANPADYTQSNTCGSAVAPGAHCSISVTFTPTAVGTRTALVSISGSGSAISLSGSATQVQLSASSLTFPSTIVGSGSAAQTVTLTNLGSTTLAVSSISLTGANPSDFSQTNICGNSVAAGGNCSVSVTFSPTATGARNSAVTITDSGGGSPQSIVLTGSGIAPAVSLSLTALTFGSQAVGIASKAQSVTLTNNGTAPLSVSSIAPNGDYTESNTCGSSVAAAGNCSISVTFSPTATGARNGGVTITDSASGSPQSIILAGVGVAPPVSLSPTSLTFGSQAVGTSSKAQAVTLTNNGTGPLSVAGIAINGDYTETNTCGSSVAAGGNCSIGVTFSPTATGARNGAVTITDSAGGSPQSIALTGTGSIYTVNPSSGSGAPQSFTFTFYNPSGNGFGYMAINSVFSSANACYLEYAVASNALYLFSNTGSPTGPVTPGGSGILQNSQCSVAASSVATSVSGLDLTVTANINFTPEFAGAKNIYMDTLTKAGAGSGWGAVGKWTVIVPPVSLSPTSLTFGSQAVGTSSKAQAVTLTNNGTGPLSVAGIAINGDYTETNTCGSSVAAGGNCSIGVTFSPTATGARNGAVTITDSAGGSPQSIALTGTGSIYTVNPSSGSGAPQSFTFTFYNPSGNGFGYMAINSVFSSANACYLEYAVASNALYLFSNTGSPTGPVTPGGSGILQNSQCSVAASSVATSVSGLDLTVTANINFTPEFAGAKNIYMDTLTKAGAGSGWGAVGKWTVIVP